MKLVQTRAIIAVAAAAAAGVVFVSCSGGGHQIPPSAQSVAADTAPQYVTVGTSVIAPSPQSGSYALPLPPGYSGSITLRAQGAPPNAKLTVRALQTVGPIGSARSTLALQPCPPPPTISIQNPFPFPITIRLQSLTMRVHCSVSGTLFGLSFYQTLPVPSVITSIKLGDATASGRIITFTPTVQKVTFPAMTTSALAIRQETSTAEVALPIVTNATSVLTSNAPTLPSTLSLQYTTAVGGTSYSSACFNAHDASGALVSDLQGIPIAGTPSFYCRIDPGSSSITFGQVVKFFVSRPKADASVFEFDGPSSAFLCNNNSTAECDTPSFNVPTYRNLIVANAQDLALCVPVVDNTDCNNIAHNASPPPATQTVSAGRSFQLLVADDPSYKPGTLAAPVPWDGVLRIAASGACHIYTSADNGNGEEPPGYSDQNQKGVGPYAEFDVVAGTSGTCTITAGEDPKFITDFSDPQNPKPRSKSLTVTVN
ncbi:MAG: hypothetical protein ABI182_03835 [Candidatus Baltobacteraceae bacterium]